MELDEDYPDINAAPHIRFERFDRDDDLIIEFDNMFSTTGDPVFPYVSPTPLPKLPANYTALTPYCPTPVSVPPPDFIPALT